MKIVFCCTQFFPSVGGTEYVAEAWANQLTVSGHSVVVITETKSLIEDSFPYKVYRKLSFFRKCKIYRSAEIILQFNLSLKEWPAIWLSGRPSVVSHHSSLYYADGTATPFAGIKNWFIQYGSKGNIACSAFIASFIGKNCAVVPNPFNNRVFTFNPSVEKKPLLVFLGRLVSDKGCLVLLKAFELLQKEGTELELMIIGEGPEKINLQEFTSTRQLDQKVHFLGIKRGEELVNLLQQSKIVVVPSLWEEPFGIVVLEAIACGCKVIASNIGGLPEAVGNCGQLFEPGNFIELADKIKMIHSANSSNLQDMEQVNQHLERHTEQNSASALEQALKTFL